MLSHEDLKSIPLFATLGEAEIIELGRVAADIHLGAGEYVVNEGDEAALLVVLRGRLEVTKLVDGIERRIGERAVGAMHGEVPLVFGTRFQSGARSTEPSRVLRVDAAPYYRIVAGSPEIGQKIGALARERIGGLQSIAAEARPAAVTLVGHRSDADDGRAAPVLRPQPDALRMADAGRARPRRPLARRAAGRSPVSRGALRGRHDAVPADPARDRGATRTADAAALHRIRHPGDRRRSRRVGGRSLRRLGGSAHHRDRARGAGGQAGTSSRIENYLGFPSGISGGELASRAHRQAVRLGAEILMTRRIEAFDPERRSITLDGGEILRARTIILATGVSWRRVPIEGFDRLIGKGVYYGAARSDAGIAQGLDVHLIGAGNSAGQAAIYLANHANSVTLVVRGDSLEKSMSQYLVDQIRGKPNIITALRSEVQALHGDDGLSAVDIIDRATGSVRRQESGGVFVFIGADAETEWLPAAFARDGRGYVLTGADLVKAGRWSEARDPYLLETSVPGAFACGDVRLSPVKRVASAVGEGSMAIAFVHQYLQTAEAPPKVE